MPSPFTAIGRFTDKPSFLYWHKTRGLPLPPGPNGSLFVGNLSDLPKSEEPEALHWLRHKDLYGPISSVTVMGHVFVIINNAQIAFELLEKRSAIYSSRPKQVFAGELLGWENAVALLPYSTQLRTHRRNASRLLGSRIKVTDTPLRSLQEAECGHFLLHVLKDPSGLVKYVRREAGAVIMKSIYGYTIESHGIDPLVAGAEQIGIEFAQAAVPGCWVVDMLPFLKWLPDWCPGAKFKQSGRKWRRNLMEFTETPHAFVKAQISHGRHTPSLLSGLLEQKNLSPEDEDFHKWTALSIYAAGADTVVSAIASFFLAMQIYPEVQHKAQEEIDRVVGPERLPNSKDRENLPYIDALVKETLRWKPVAPMGLPHTSTADDIFEGYSIPRGATLLPNVWSVTLLSPLALYPSSNEVNRFFTHDPATYSDPMTFNPDRFLSSDKNLTPEFDPHRFAFGFGRRVCPGRFLADSMIFLTIAQSLAVFNIRKARTTDTGVEIEPDIGFKPGVVSHPAPFSARVTPRSEKHEQLVRDVEKVFPWEKSDADKLDGRWSLHRRGREQEACGEV
ncbi:putative cytochrome P450 oxidoreductase [Aspergillus steynii IBT 23096]|uniref:Putative cytochrome P450 oxidoreductase n=1 Tax=Aspergillus steynii IBT 23096 TaxID=1392250 RepID=A0A2I2GGI9_9EURO|nr:putative cytochrome P450 oxidoreductase [Aspergillus steynii IBT 23096]PLB51998.1 putative cytochrome P450 oxidoreductase [Aspergillus steynii IBT 23096]